MELGDKWTRGAEGGALLDKYSRQEHISGTAYAVV